MLSELTEKQKHLAEFMSELSEEAYCAGWMLGLEYALWAAVSTGPRSFGRLDISVSQIERLRRLSLQCEGWIVFDEETGETWVGLPEWEQIFASREGGPPK